MTRLAVVAVVLLAVSPVSFRAQSAPSASGRESVYQLLQQARAQAGIGNAAAGLEVLRRARVLAPNSEEILSAFAQMSLAVRAPLPAIGALEPLTRMCPTVAQYHYLLGVALLQAGDPIAAVDSLQAAERLDPNRALTLIALGLALNSRKLYADARPYLQRGLELEPGNVEALAALGEAYEGIGDASQADAFATRALAQDGRHATANLVVGLVLMKQERYADARDALAKSITADPTSAKAHYQLSLAYARLGDAGASQKYLDLYQQKLREMEDRVEQLRHATGRVIEAPRK